MHCRRLPGLLLPSWEVDADPASMAYYHTLPESEIRRRIFSVLDQDEYGNTIFRLSDQKRCPFLNSENLCDMHIAIGGEHTPFTCRTFPRFINEFGALREMGLSFSCPVAAEMMFDPKYDFAFTEEMNDLPQPSMTLTPGYTSLCCRHARPLMLWCRTAQSPLPGAWRNYWILQRSCKAKSVRCPQRPRR